MEMPVWSSGVVGRLAVIAVIFASSAGCAQAETVDGFVTRIDSPADFHVGMLHIVTNAETKCSIRRATLAAPPPHGWSRDPNITSMVLHPWGGDGRRIPCDTSQMAQYTRVHVRGAIRSGDGSFIAADLIEYDIVLDVSKLNFNDGVILEEASALSRGKRGWSGKMWVDGYPVTVTPDTLMLPEPDDTTFRFGFHFTQIAARIQRTAKNASQLSSTTGLPANTSVVFRAHRTLEGKATATQLQFWPNWVDPDQKKYNEKFAVSVQPPDYSKGTAGTIQYVGAPPIAILPNKAVQDWISNQGEALIPSYQKSLPGYEATKIHFHFYVVRAFPAQFGKYFVETSGVLPEFQVLYWDRSSSTYYGRPRSGAMVRNIVAASDGTVLIPEEILGELRNCAQLETLLSAAITSVIQGQAYHTWTTNAFVQASYFYNGDPWNVGSWQTEQALRIGIRQMYLAGYDIREAPFAWAVAQGKPVKNPVMNSRDANKEIPWYAAYAFNYISKYYKDVDYSRLKRGEAEYQDFLGELRKADPEVFGAKD